MSATMPPENVTPTAPVAPSDAISAQEGAYPVTDRTRLRRLPKRGAFDRETVYRILDEGFVCHVGVLLEGRPYVIPTGYARIGDTLLIHGSSRSTLLMAIEAGAEVCITVTLLDGLVLARSAFHHSVNYRSVVLFGQARAVEDPEEKTAALLAFTEHIVPGRAAEVRPPNALELKATLVLSIPLLEVSAKVRNGPPVDDLEDMDLPVWAGVLPIQLATGVPQTAPDLTTAMPVPEYVRSYSRS